MLAWFENKKRKKQLETLFEVHYPQLYRLAYAWTQDESCALDLVQETLLKAMEKSDQITEFDQANRWLCKIMHHLFYDKCRHENKWQHGDVDEIDEHFHEASVETLYIHHQTISTIHDAIGALPVQQKEVITLVDVEGYTYQKTADILGVPIGTVMSRLARAREKVRKLIHRADKQRLERSTNNVINMDRYYEK
jgi:RNA polymerase sigma-70 factor (ECF subfamily)